MKFMRKTRQRAPGLQKVNGQTQGQSQLSMTVVNNDDFSRLMLTWQLT